MDNRHLATMPLFEIPSAVKSSCLIGVAGAPSSPLGPRQPRLPPIGRPDSPAVGPRPPWVIRRARRPPPHWAAPTT
eukprot:7861501-Heterocapsa_arctica.AAC.1